MKRCPQCGREYDNSMSFCLDDGGELLYGPASMDEPATAILSQPSQLADGRFGSETATRAQIHPTAKAEERSQSPAVLGTASNKQNLFANRAAKPLIFTLLGVILIAGGFLAYQYFNPVPTVQINSIAVLPFQNRSANPDTDYLSDGLSDSLIYRLTQFPNLKVSPTSSVIRYKDSKMEVAEIARELEVDAVMSGKLAQRGDDLTISVELIDARTRKLIWAEQYDRKMADLLATQREIATTIAQKLELKLAGDEARGITKKYTDSNEAYQLYLKGRFHYAKRTKEDFNKGIDYFQQAVKLDPKFALAYAMIADLYASMPAYPYLSPKEALPQAKAAAAKALEIDPTLAEAHTSIGYSLCFSDWNWTDAERSLRRALELDPKNSLAHLRSGIYFLSTGRTAEAVKATETAMELEPLNLVNGANLVWMFMADGRMQEALTQGRKTHDLDPNFILGRYQLGLAYNANGMYADAVALADKTLQADPDNQLMLGVVGYAYAKSGRPGDARAVINRFKEIRKTQYAISYFVATIYAGLNEKENAFAELEKAYQERDWRMTAHLKKDFMLEPLRNDPRYEDLLKRFNLSK